MKNKRLIGGISLFLVGFVFLMIVLRFDPDIARWVNSLRNPILDSIMFFVTYSSTFIMVLFPMIFAFKERKLRHLSVSILSAYVIVLIIKLIVQRLRPFNFGLDTPLELIESKYSQWDFSFPSSHAAVSMSSWFFIPEKFRKVWLILPLIIMFSRVYFGLHYLSDIIIGALIGYAISCMISKNIDKTIEVKLLDKLKRKSRRK